jgi:hypothetical protein
MPCKNDTTMLGIMRDSDVYMCILGGKCCWFFVHDIVWSCLQV